MIGQPAKVLAPGDVRRMLRAASHGRHPRRNKVMILLSVKAGLRACEIARMTWPMVLDARGKVGNIIELPASAAKMGSGRRIPIHADLKAALVLLAKSDALHAGPVIASERQAPMAAKSVVNWFKALFVELDLQGCSSHSGRRTFVTQAARLIHKAGGSIRDVQELVGHKSIKTTQGYIEGSSDAQRRLIRYL